VALDRLRDPASTTLAVCQDGHLIWPITQLSEASDPSLWTIWASRSGHPKAIGLLGGRSRPRRSVFCSRSRLAARHWSGRHGRCRGARARTLWRSHMSGGTDFSEDLLYAPDVTRVELLASMPEDVKQALPPFAWSVEDLWKLDRPIEDFPVDRFTWLLDLPMWRWRGRRWQISMQDVLSDPEQFREHYEKSERADTRYPIHVTFTMTDGSSWTAITGCSKPSLEDKQASRRSRSRRMTFSVVPHPPSKVLIVVHGRTADSGWAAWICSYPTAPT
jgi:hypothetical protein